jgi:hypothetical protein
MFGLSIFAGLVAAGFLLAKLRGRGNEKPNVTRLMTPGR